MQTMKCLHTLREVPLFMQFKRTELIELATRMTKRRFKKGSALMREGEVGHEFFVIAKGVCSVIHESTASAQQKCIAQLHAGDYCGEQSLLSSEPRNATVTADEDVVALVITRDVFSSLVQNKIAFAKRSAVCAGGFELKNDDDRDGAADGEAQQQKYERAKSPIERKWIWYTVSGNVLFAQLTAQQKSAVIDGMYKRTLPRGEVLIRQGEEHGNEFYVIRSGKLSCTNDATGEVKLLCAGDCCGELALLYGAPRAMTVTAVTDDAVVWCAHRMHLRGAIMAEASAQRTRHIEFLKAVPLFSSLLTNELSAIDDAMSEQTFSGGERIIRKGDDGDRFYVVKDGECKVVIGAKSTVLRAGDYFGERALLTNTERAADIVVKSELCTVLSLSRHAFDALLGPLTELMQRNMAAYKRNLRQMIETRRQLSHERVSSVKFCADVAQLKTIGLLGRGGYGAVSLVRDPVNGKTFALKAVRKDRVLASGQSVHINNERALMMQMDSVHLVRLWHTFQDARRVYFLLDVCLGGDLFTVLRKSHSFKEYVARFYAACVIEGLGHLHAMQMVYRDLKPENLVLASDGYVKITDFGFCKTLDDSGKSYTLCGTPDYLAPEMIRGKGHGKGVDYWTFGILIYEMLASMPPFYDRDASQIYRKICRAQPHYPSYISQSAKDLIRRLLKKRPVERIGVTAGGVERIKSHAWFAAEHVRFDFDKLNKKELRAPYVPKLKSDADISHFRCKVVKEKPFAEIADHSPFKDF